MYIESVFCTHAALQKKLVLSRKTECRKYKLASVESFIYVKTKTIS